MVRRRCAESDLRRLTRNRRPARGLGIEEARTAAQEEQKTRSCTNEGVANQLPKNTLLKQQSRIGHL
jgi:hypothetical protein